MDRFNMEEFISSIDDDMHRPDPHQRIAADGSFLPARGLADQGGALYSNTMGSAMPAHQQVKSESLNSLEELDLFDLLDPGAPNQFDAAAMDRAADAQHAPGHADLRGGDHHALPGAGLTGFPPNGVLSGMGLADSSSPYGYSAPNIRMDPIINVVEPEETASSAQNYVDDAFPMYSASGVPLKAAQVPMFASAKDDFANSYESSPSTSPHMNVHGDYGQQAPGMASRASPHMSPLMTTNTIPPGTPHSGNGGESPFESPLASPMIGSPLSGFDGSNDSSAQGFTSDLTSPMVEEPFDSFQRLDVPLRHSRALSDNWGDRERAAFLDTLAAQTQNTEGSLEFPKIQVHHASPALGQPAQLGVPQTRHRSHSSPYEPTNDLKGGQMFACELCDKRFTRAYNLRSHMRTHTDERPFACKHCGKAFARQHDRKRHEALHSGEKRFVCSGEYSDMAWGCKKRFARADALGRHFRTEAGKACLRPLIDRIFTNGDKKDSAPEGILFTGIIDGEPQVVLAGSKDGSGQKNEREDHTRRTVIVTAVAEQLHGMLINGPSQLPNDIGIPSGA